MRAVVQRVGEASVSSEGETRAIGAGLLVLLAVENGDTEREASWMAEKIARLRVFADDAGKMNRSVSEVGGSVLVVSNFTVAGSCARGRRPSFDGAMEPTRARGLVERVVEGVRGSGIGVETGWFGAMMRVRATNEGPVTLVVETGRG